MNSDRWTMCIAASAAFLWLCAGAVGADDCNGNGVDDAQDIAAATSTDINSNGVPDECEVSEFDCNGNGVMDDCELAAGTSTDCNGDGLLDECEPRVLYDYLPAAGPFQVQGVGYSLATSNGVALALAYRSPDQPRAQYVFVRGVDGWEFAQELEPTIAAAGRWTDADVFGDVIVLGDAYAERDGVEEAGVAYVFRRQGGQWVQEAVLGHSAPQAQDHFGQAVKARNDMVVVGSYAGADTFVRTSEGWEERDSLPIAYRRFDATENTLVVGDSYVTPEGAIRIYGRSEDCWVLEATFDIPGNPDIASDFYVGGVRVGDDVVICARYGSNTLYVFREVVDAWKLEQVISVDDIDGLEFEFSDGAVSTDRIAVGSRGRDETVQLYRYVDGVWEHAACIVGEPNSDFGNSVAIDGDEVLIGAPRDDHWGADLGAIYVTPFEGSDCDNDGVPDHAEILCGTASDCNENDVDDACDIASGTSPDIDGDGVPDECSECNGNGVADHLDIASGFSLDCNEDGIPDECQGVLFPLDTSSVYEFGTSIAISGNITAHKVEVEVDGVTRSAVDVYRFDGSTWVWEKRLSPTVNETSTTYGRNIAVDGDLMAVGPYDLYVYRRDGGAWTQLAVLQHDDGDSGNLGEVLYVSGDTIVAGTAVYEPYFDQGEVYVYNVVGDDVIRDASRYTFDLAGGMAFANGAFALSRIVNEYDMYTPIESSVEIVGHRGGTCWISQPSGTLAFGDDLAFDGDHIIIDGYAYHYSDHWEFVGQFEGERNIRLKGDYAAVPVKEWYYEWWIVIKHFDGGAWRDVQKWYVGQDWSLNLAMGESWLAIARRGSMVGGTGGLLRVGGLDVNGDGAQTLCELMDCDGDGAPDLEEIASDAATDCNDNLTLDACEIAAGVVDDCDSNGVPDSCDLANGAAHDCDGNGIPDSCDIASGTLEDADGDGVPDACDAGAGDLNCDGAINAFDIDPFVLALVDGTSYAVTYQGCSILNADCNGDGVVNAFDIDPFVKILVGGGQ